MGAVPGFCDANHRSFIARKYLGQPPMNLGTVPNLLQSCLTSAIRAKGRNDQIGDFNPQLFHQSDRTRRNR